MKIGSLLLLAAACTSTPSTDAGVDAGVLDCGVGCPKCSEPMQIIDPQGLCTSQVACHMDADCSATLPSACEQDLGTYTYDFKSVGCLSGTCAYRMNYGGCSDLTACSACSTLPACADHDGGTGACVSCVSELALDATLSQFVCAACSTCASSGLCNGGDGGTTDACAGCALASLSGSGAVLNDPRFRNGCLDAGQEGCAGVARRLLSCRR
jgi:hypothetical protein